MKKTFRLLGFALMAMLTSASIASCSVSDNPVSTDEGAVLNEHDILLGEDGERGSMASDEQFTLPVAVLSSLPEGYATAVFERFTDVVDDSDVARLAILDASQLEANTDKVAKIYAKGGIVALVNANVEELNGWMRELNLPYEIAPVEELPVRSLYAFSRKNIYLLDQLDESVTVNENLNPFMTWLNGCFVLNAVQGGLSLGASNSIDISEVMGAINFQHTFSYNHRWCDEYKIWGKYESWIWGNGSVTVSYSVWPFYNFTDNSDYYIVKSQVVTRSKDMCPSNLKDCPNHKWTNEYALCYLRLCAYYMTETTFNSALMIYENGEYKNAPDVMFPAGKSPIPVTTTKQTTYSNNVNWGLGADITLGSSQKIDSHTSTDAIVDVVDNVSSGFNAGVTLSGSVSFTNTQTTTITDNEVHNNSTSSEARYSYTTTNLPRYDLSVRITDPPARSVNNADFDNLWVWRVSNIEEGSKQEFFIESKLDVQYGSCHFLSTGADFAQYRFWMSRADDEDIMGSSIPMKSHFKIPAPNRTRSGLLTINNAESSTGYYVYDIVITDTKNNQTVSSGQTSFGVGDKYRIFLPEGKYSITLKKGPSYNSSKSATYKLSRETIEISTRNQDKGQVTLNSSFDFAEKQ